MNNKIKKAIPILTMLVSFIVISLFASSFFSGKKTITINNNLDQKISPIVNATEKPENGVSILFLGDMMFDRYIRQIGEKKGYSFPFQKVVSLLANNDLVVGNLEGPITNNQSVSLDSKMGEKNNYIFTFDPKLAKTLAEENIKLVNIGNNHIANFGSSGIENTRDYLTQSGVDFFGDPEKIDKRMTFKNVKWLNIAFVNYNQFVLNGKQKTVDDISKAKNVKADMIIIYTHWGKEFVDQPDQKIKELAHEFVDAGADLIIGTHPHVVQSKEEYKGKMIYYSLGNFIFDQYFDPKTQTGLAVQITIIPMNKKIEFKEFQIKMKNNGQSLIL
jgi:poly-gamma-glutamate synthesis protein (capsule biosynthesis protein)